MLGDATIQTVLEDRFVHENVYLGPICLPYFSAVSRKLSVAESSIPYKWQG